MAVLVQLLCSFRPGMTCGIHVHLSHRPKKFDQEELRQFVKAIVFFDAALAKCLQRNQLASCEKEILASSTGNARNKKYHV